MFFVLVSCSNGKANVSAKCFLSMRKNEPPHSPQVAVEVGKTVSGARCSCVAGASGYCHHVFGLLFYIAHYKQVRVKAFPDELLFCEEKKLRRRKFKTCL